MGILDDVKKYFSEEGIAARQARRKEWERERLERERMIELNKIKLEIEKKKLEEELKK